MATRHFVHNSYQIFLKTGYVALSDSNIKTIIHCWNKFNNSIQKEAEILVRIFSKQTVQIKNDLSLQDKIINTVTAKLMRVRNTFLERTGICQRVCYQEIVIPTQEGDIYLARHDYSDSPISLSEMRWTIWNTETLEIYPLICEIDNPSFKKGIIKIPRSSINKQEHSILKLLRSKYSYDINNYFFRFSSCIIEKALFEYAFIKDLHVKNVKAILNDGKGNAKILDSLEKREEDKVEVYSVYLNENDKMYGNASLNFNWEF